MNSLGREPLSPFAPRGTDASLHTSNELVQHIVIEPGGISYYVRNRVEIIAGIVTLVSLFGTNIYHLCSAFFPLKAWNRVATQEQQR